MGKSHILGLTRIGQELARRNHTVTIMLGSADKMKEVKELSYTYYKVPYEEDFLEKVLVYNAMKGGLKESLFGNGSSLVAFGVYCKSLLDNKQLIESFKNYDIIINDDTFYCGGLFAAKLGIKRVAYVPCPPRLPHIFMIDDSFMTLSYIPMLLTRNPGKMNFLQRLKNFIAFWSLKGINNLLFYPLLVRLKATYGIKPEKSLMEIFEEKELTLFMSDFSFEYAQPLRPDYKSIGPVSIQPVQVLPIDLQQVIDSSGDNGFIIVSFGSNLASVLDEEKVDIMAEAFGRLKQTVIWRLQGYKPVSLNKNIIISDWLPQNDLLANKKLKAFVSHVGMNGMYEALYHGVPVVAMPLYADQFDNAVQMEDRGVALIADYFDLKVDDLYNLIQRVMLEPSFRKNAQRISRLMKDRPRSPVQEAGDWIEYALRHDSLAHLRPYSSQLAWYQYFLVDVALFLVLVLVLVMMVIKYTFRFVCWLCCRRNNKLKTQ